MNNEKVWIISDEKSKTLTHILVNIYFSQEIQNEIKIYDDVNNLEDLSKLNIYRDNQVIYYAFENVKLSDRLKEICIDKKIKYFDMYSVVYTFLGGVYSKISKGGNISNILKQCINNGLVHFALSNDDGSNPKSIYESDIVIIGVSRTSKTPLSIYMSNLGYKVTNIPLVPEIEIPRELYDIDSNKIYALTMDPDVLIEIRKERTKSLGIPVDSSYATRDRVLQELDYSMNIINSLSCKHIDVTHISIEETSDKIINYIKNKEEI